MKTVEQWIEEYTKDKHTGNERLLKFRNGDFIQAIQQDATNQYKELLEEIQNWMIDNDDFECGEHGSEIYSKITKLLNKNE